MERKSIGVFIAALRKANGMTQKDFAEMLNVSDKTVSRWERDESAPDISLIPVIAEIFGVTSDELIRGERVQKSPEITPGGQSGDVQPSQRTAKQLKRLLSQAQVNFKTGSIISAGIAAVGLIGAMIANFGFNRAYIGFFVGCVFLIAALICESIFLVRTFSSVSSDEFDAESISLCKIGIIKTAESVYSFIVCSFSALIPLFVFPSDAYQGVTANTWFDYAFKYVFVGAGFCFITAAVIKNYAVNKKIIAVSEAQQKPAKADNSLKVKIGIVTAVILFCTLAVQGYVNSVYANSISGFVEGRSFDTYEAFVTFMETPMKNESGTENDFYFNNESEETEEYTDSKFTDPDEMYSLDSIYDSEDNVVCSYRWKNETVSRIEASEDILPLTVYTYEEVSEANEKLANIMNIFSALYFIEISAAAAIYLLKKASLSRAKK